MQRRSSPKWSPSHCGPCSLSYCLHVLGIDADQHEVARASGLSYWKRYKRGQDEQDIQRAARAYRAQCQFHSAFKKQAGRAFAARRRLPVGTVSNGWFLGNRPKGGNGRRAEARTPESQP